MQALTTIDQLDAKLQECATAGQVSDDNLREVFRTFRMNFSGELPDNLFDPAYAVAAQMRTYERAAGRCYALSNITAADPRFCTMIGAKDAGGRRPCGAERGYCPLGPYVSLDPGRYVGRVLLGAGEGRSGQLVPAACTGRGTRVFASTPPLDVAALLHCFGIITMEFALGAWKENIELRLFRFESFWGSITEIEFTELSPASAA